MPEGGKVRYRGQEATYKVTGPQEPETPVVEKYALTFVAADDAEPLEGADIKVYSNAERTDEIIEYSKLEAGIYYYTITKAGFETIQDSVEIVDADIEVKINLIAEKVTITVIAKKQVAQYYTYNIQLSKPIDGVSKWRLTYITDDGRKVQSHDRALHENVLVADNNLLKSVTVTLYDDAGNQVGEPYENLPVTLN